MTSIKRFAILLSIGFLMGSCARKGTPSGGPKDEDPPTMILAKPAHESLNFQNTKIRLYFDEYIVLRDLNKKLIISPPFNTPALITPQGTPSKYINIEILDSLKANTTYTFNFGDAIRDNNENNILENYKYVFSTGSFIDSLTLKGSVIDVLEENKSKNYNVLLYQYDEHFNDSIVYKEPPSYVTKTHDSLHFKFTNIREGKYKVYALEEENSNYLFNSKTDKIGFLNNIVSLPKDSTIVKNLRLFFEDQPYKFKRAKEIKKGKIQFAFTGKQTNINVALLTKVPKSFKFFTQLNKTKDSLNLWHTPVKLDSLNFAISNENVTDSIRVTLRKNRIDSLSISTNVKSKFIHFNDTLKILTNNPIQKINKDKFLLFVSDSVNLDFKIKELSFNELGILFEKKVQSKYQLKLLPSAIEDLYQVALKDTLNYVFVTKQLEDYGAIHIDINKQVNKPLIVELLSNNKVMRKKYLTASEKVEFKLLDPDKYKVRVIIDENENGVWDTGNYLKKQQPEQILYFETEFEVRPNWIFNETMNIKR